MEQTDIQEEQIEIKGNVLVDNGKVKVQKTDIPPTQEKKAVPKPFELNGDNSTLGMLSPKDEHIRSMSSNAELIVMKGNSYDDHAVYPLQKPFGPSKP